MVESVGRIFVAVALDLETRHALVASHAGLDFPGKVVPPDNWHLTLRYVGNIDEVGFDRLLAAIDQAELGKGFSIGFGGFGAFPNPRKATVLWRAVTDPDARLPQVAAEIEEACQVAGIEAEDRPYRAHLTLARIRPDRDVRSLVSSDPPVSVAMDVSDVCVFRSHLGRPHATYEILERFPLV